MLGTKNMLEAKILADIERQVQISLVGIVRSLPNWKTTLLCIKTGGLGRQVLVALD